MSDLDFCYLNLMKTFSELHTNIKRIKNLVALASYIILIVVFVPKEFRAYAIFAATVLVLLFVLLLIFLSERYRSILIIVTWVIVSITMTVLAIHLYQQHKLKQEVELEQEY